MNPTRQTITLPSGASVLVRALRVRDYIDLGDPPGEFPKPGADGKVPPLTPNQMKWQVGITRTILSRCTGPVLYPDGSRRRIVDKPFAEAGDTELSIEEMEDADAMAIVAAVNDLAPRKEAGPEARRFPDTQPNLAADPGSSGAPLREASERTGETLPG